MTDDEERDSRELFDKLTAPPSADVVGGKLVPVEEPADLARIGQDAEDDIAFARRNMKDALETAKGLLQDAADVASSSQDPESFSAAGSILNSLANANKTLVQLSKTRLEMGHRLQTAKGNTAPVGEQPRAVFQGPTQVFIGSPGDLLKRIKPAEEDEQ